MLGATQRRTFGYSLIFEVLNLKPGHHAMNESGLLLDEINRLCNRLDLPMLSALVVSESRKPAIPGNGFFTLAQALGKLNPGQDHQSFWKQEVNRVYDADWSKLISALNNPSIESQALNHSPVELAAQ